MLIRSIAKCQFKCHFPTFFKWIYFFNCFNESSEVFCFLKGTFIILSKTSLVNWECLSISYKQFHTFCYYFEAYVYWLPINSSCHKGHKKVGSQTKSKLPINSSCHKGHKKVGSQTKSKHKTTSQSNLCSQSEIEKLKI